jgi:hypothetical protein
LLLFRVRQNRIRMQQEAQRDAPDARESRPPCYSDAILLPRLDGSFASLDELNNGRIKHKRRRRKTEESDDLEEEVPLRRNRCRSEEVISMREIVTGSVRPSRLPPRIHPFEIEPIDMNRSSNEDEEPEEVQYPSTTIMTLEHSPGPSRARTPKASLQPDGESSEAIKNFNNTLERSPYAKRKLKHMESFKGDKNKGFGTPASLISSTSVPETPRLDSIEIVDDYFNNERQRNSSVESLDSSEFISINMGKHSSNSSSNEDGLVVLRKPSNI